MTLKEILQSCRNVALFLSKYTLGDTHDYCIKLIKEIDKYVEEEELF